MCGMQSSGARCCMTALQLFALDRRGVLISYKHFENTSSMKLAFDRLPETERKSLEERAQALQHDAALRPLWDYGDANLCVVDAVGSEDRQ